MDDKELAHGRARENILLVRAACAKVLEAGMSPGRWKK